MLKIKIQTIMTKIEKALQYYKERQDVYIDNIQEGIDNNQISTILHNSKKLEETQIVIDALQMWNIVDEVE